MWNLPFRLHSAGAKLGRRATSLFLSALALLGFTPAPTQAEPTIADRVAAVRNELGKRPAGIEIHAQPPGANAVDDVNAAEQWGNWGNWGNWANFSNWGNWGNWFNA